MGKNVPLLILVLMLSSLSPIAMQEEGVGEEIHDMGASTSRFEISPDPDSIRDLGKPVISTGEEGSRDPWADSSIGVFTNGGLILSDEIPDELQEARSDLRIVVVDGETGLWEARNEIIESTGATIRSTIPPSGFLIQGSEGELQKVASLPVIESSHVVPLALLVDKQLWLAEPQSQNEVELNGWKDTELNRLDTTGLGIGGKLSELAIESLGGHWSPGTGIHFGTIGQNQIFEIAMNPQVSYISLTPVLSTSNNLARSHMEINTVETFFFTGLNGSGQTVGVADTGIDHDHGDFGNRIVQRVDVANDGSTADTNDGHGTHVSCTVLGSGSRTSSYEGVAPEAQLYMQAMENDNTGQLSGPGVYSLLNSAYSSGSARIHTNSRGSFDSGGDYTTQSEDADDRTSTWDQYWLYDGMAVLFAAGNERDDGVSPPGTAKNVITVGAHVNRYSNNAADEMYYWSSRGPTDDGRIKPDIVAPGDYIRSCRAQEATEAPNNINDPWYVEYSGTSMATPAAAGASALVREYLMEIAERPAPQGALVKALLILGAEDMGTRDIPNNDEGWGRLNLVNTLIPDNDVGIFVDDRSRLSSGQEASYNFEITRAGEPLKVVLAWSDYPGSTFSGTQLRNDLNLEVTSPNGMVTYLGNDFANGKSTTGGSKDNKNNVEVVLIDSASLGIWNVKVKDFSHGGSRSQQPFAIAVRGVNVNDLTPDPAILPESFEISTPIPQVGELTQFSVTVVNQGSGSFPEVFVSAYINSNLLGTQSLGMSPGEDIQLEWDWTPQFAVDTEIRIEIDPNDQLEELYEDNNVLTQNILVSAPGIQASTENPWRTLEDASDATTSWEITMTNLALFETNATIDVSSPIRTIDGISFDWFKSFDKYEVNLGPAASTTVNLTLVHPSPPDPGTYAMVVTSTDIEYDVESQLEIFFDVPVLAQPGVSLPSETIPVDTFEITNISLDITNLGNGAQTYDVELISPAGWEVGFDELGPFPGSNQGSTGTMAKDATISAGVSVTPPGTMIQAGSTFTTQLLVKSRVSSEVWTYDLPLLVSAFDSIEFTPPSGGNDAGVPADSLHQIPIQISNQGNRDLTITPIIRSLPGGWSVEAGLQELQVSRGTSSQWTFSIQGNGLAAGGLFEVRFLVEDGDYFDWNTTLDVVSGAIPSVSFHEVVFPLGSSFESSSNPLGLGAHPVGSPGFELGWRVVNEGTSNWDPSASMELPDQDWSSSCLVNPPRIGPGETSMVWCTIVIPEHEEAGSEPEVVMVLSGEGIESRRTISLLVETVKEVEWKLDNFNEANEGYSTTLYFTLTNTGNTVISNRLVTNGPSGWGIRILDGVLVTLQPGEARSVQVAFTPNTGSDAEISLMLADADDVSGMEYSMQIDVISDSSGDGSSAFLYILGLFLLISSAAGAALFAFSRSGGDISKLLGDITGSENSGAEIELEPHSGGTMASPPVGNTTHEDVQGNLESYSDYPGWLWDSSKEEWVPDPDYDEGPP